MQYARIKHFMHAAQSFAKTLLLLLLTPTDSFIIYVYVFALALSAQKHTKEKRVTGAAFEMPDVQ
jgi:hypothetical protein